MNGKRKYESQDKRPQAIAWRREMVAEAARKGMFREEVAEFLGVHPRTVHKIAVDLGVEFRANKFHQRRAARLDLDEYVVTMAGGLAASVDRALDMLDGNWDDLDPEARATAHSVLSDTAPRMARLRRSLGGQVPKPEAPTGGAGASHWVTVDEDTWQAFRIATEIAGDSPGTVLGRAVEQYLKKGET